MPADFDGIARVYRTLEYLAFGRSLEAARFQFLDRVRSARDILVLGEGDGRCLNALLRAAPEATIHCVDASARMLELAERRVAASAAGRVRFERVDAMTLTLEPRRYDAVVTMFFLDCFTVAAVQQLISRVSASVRPGALWLFADFAIPAAGWSRRRARIVVGALYRFFRWRTGIAAASLPPSESLLREAGWQPRADWDARAGMVRSVVFQFQ